MSTDVTTILKEVKTALNMDLSVKTYSLDEYCDRYTAEFEQSHDVELTRSFVVRDIDPTTVERLVTGITNKIAREERDLIVQVAAKLKLTKKFFNPSAIDQARYR
ncbi:MAG: hypothetical protein PHD57_12235 [Desulfobacterales bacterium]|jgi:hypothetical protein|nr:hypothetical protein [Desulfobacterales bacterium]MDD4455629.1 hypothetical protein [Candidatus Methanomethylophilaceae archaeon]